MKFIISTKLNNQGFTVNVNNKQYPVNYPISIWKTFPIELRQPFAEFIAFMSTRHLAFPKQTYMAYQFPTPLGEALFSYGLLQSMPENQLDFKNKKTSEYVKIVLNSFYRISFTGHARNNVKNVDYTPRSDVALVPFTFGKDSLLTYALCKKYGIRPVPIFMLEPSNKNENAIKTKLIKEFSQEFGESIETFSVPLAELKQTHGSWWGWDIFLTQYTMFLIPFMHFYKANYFFWSNEQNCNEVILDHEGFLTNATFEQSARWMQVLNTGLRLFGSNAKLGSLIEPLTELSILHILHTSFEKYAKYQTSCLNDLSKTARWCGRCYECARVYISLLALGIEPKNIELNTNMLTKMKRSLLYVFSDNESDLHTHFTFTKEEKLLAFYLAYKRGVKGILIDEFKKNFLPMVEKKAFLYVKRYLAVHSSITIPEELKKNVLSFYESELQKLRTSLH